MIGLKVVVLPLSSQRQQYQYLVPRRGKYEYNLTKDVQLPPFFERERNRSTEGLFLSVKNITDYMEKEQVQTLLDYAQACSPRNYLILRILWRTGVRVSELLSIRPQDLEPNNQVINITRAKGNKQRRVMLDPETKPPLRVHFNPYHPEFQPIFTLSNVQVWNIVKKYGRMINVDIHPHTFRHSFAIHLVRPGLDLRRVQQLLGHSNLNTTQVYLQFKDEDLREGYNKVEF